MLHRLRALDALLPEEFRAGVQAAASRLERATFLLAVLGEFSSGKSFLLNAMLERFHYEESGGGERLVGLLATDINPSTATITEIEYGPAPQAHAQYEDGRLERVPLDRLSRFVAAKEDRDAPVRVSVEVDAPFLQRGFSLADTPGLASVNPAHRRATLQFLPRADAVLYLIDTQQPFSEGDAAFLGIVRRHLETIFIVQTKIDLWQQPTESGAPAWKAAQDRIEQLAAIYAPGTYVYAVSAREYVEGRLREDAQLVERSRFGKFLEALDASLVRNTGRERLRRVRDRTSQASGDALARIERDLEMLALTDAALRARRASAEPECERLRGLAASLGERCRRGTQGVQQELLARGEQLASEAERALTQAFDSADVARLRDRARLHVLIDRTLAQTVEIFANEAAAAVDDEFAQLTSAGADLRLRFAFPQAAAEAFGSGGSTLWNEDPVHALGAAIVLEALGGPAIALVDAIASAFARAPAGTYMKRELTADLRAEFFPRFSAEMRAFARETGERFAKIGHAYGDAVHAALSLRCNELLGSIDRAVEAKAHSVQTQAELQERHTAIVEEMRAIDAAVDAFLARGEEIAPADAGGETVRRAHVEANLDRESYARGLRPQRWRVAVLGALRRGKSSLINSFAGHRVLSDETAGEIAFPVHVRYGEHETAFALEADGTWREIEFESALDEAARNPVLILTPWKMPHELVLVHAPAFDAGGSTPEDVCMVAARAASEVLCLFSRQLSDRELDLYGRVAELGKPLSFVHTLADNETSNERRHVLELAEQYLRERAIPAERIYAVSTLEYAQAKREQRAPAGWNELDALISTIGAHAEEHMNRLDRLARAAQAPVAAPPPEQPPAPAKGFFARLLGR